MLPDLFELFDVDLYGIAFERVLFAVVGVLGVWGLWGGVVDWRDAEEGQDRSGAGIRAVLGLGMVAWAGVRGYQTLTPEHYDLLFKQEVVIHTYAFAIVTGFGLGVWLSARAAEREGLRKTVVLDLAFWALIGGMLGSRLIFIVVNLDNYVAACTNPSAVGLMEPDCTLVFKFWEGGLVFYGAILGAGAVFYFYAKRNGLSMLQLVDIGVPSLALGHAYGRFGCMGAGCCWGGECTTGWGVAYPRGSQAFDAQLEHFRATGDAGMVAQLEEMGHSLHVHPTQLYESMGEGLIFVFLVLYRPWRRIHGELLGCWLLLYGCFRVLNELMRGDRLRGYLFELRLPFINDLFAMPAEHPTLLSTSQFIGVLMAVGGIVMLAWLRHRRAGLEAAVRT